MATWTSKVDYTDKVLAADFNALQTLKADIQKKTAANLGVLDEGEFGLETDTRRVLMGSSVGNQVIKGDYVTPEMYGAKGDGVTNDAAAIQAAIGAASGKTLLISPGNWNLGTTGIIISQIMSIKMMPHSRFTYTGPDAAVTIDVSSVGTMTGTNLDLYDIYSTGTYGIKITSGGLPHSKLFLQGRITIRNIWNYTMAGIYVDASFSQNDINVLGLYCATPPKTAWGLYFVKGEATNLFESNQIRVGCVYSARGLYGDSAFSFNYVNIDIDTGATESLTDKIDVAGSYNTLIIRSMSPSNIYYPAGLRLRSTAQHNVISMAPVSLTAITDDSPAGSNTIIAPYGMTNLIKNPSFEINSGAAFPNWTASNLSSATAETVEFKHGYQGIKLVPSAGYSFIQQALPSSVLGKTVTVSGWFKAVATNFGSQVLTLGDDTSTNDVGIPADGRWHYMGIRRTFAVGATNPYFRIWASVSGPAGDILYADGCMGVLGGVPTLPAEIIAQADTIGPLSTDGTNVDNSGVYKKGAIQVVGAQGATVADAAGGATIDTEARAAINALLARIRTHGLIAT